MLRLFVFCMLNFHLVLFFYNTCYAIYFRPVIFFVLLKTVSCFGNLDSLYYLNFCCFSLILLRWLFFYQEDIAKSNNGTNFIWAKDADERQKLWKARHELLYACTALFPGSKVSCSNYFIFLAIQWYILEEKGIECLVHSSLLGPISITWNLIANVLADFLNYADGPLQGIIWTKP